MELMQELCPCTHSSPRPKLRCSVRRAHSACSLQQAVGAVEGRVSPGHSQNRKPSLPAPLQAGQVGTSVVGQTGHMGGGGEENPGPPCRPSCTLLRCSRCRRRLPRAKG